MLVDVARGSQMNWCKAEKCALLLLSVLFHQFNCFTYTVCNYSGIDNIDVQYSVDILS